MAKSTKGKTETSKIDESVADAVEASDQEVENLEADTVITDDIPDDEDGLDLEGTTPEPDDFEMEIVDDTVVGTADEPVTENAMQQPVQSEGKSSGGFIPLLLGGVVAGAIGYGIATFYPLNDGSDDVTVRLAAQADQIAALEAQVAAIPEPDFSGLEAQIADVGAQTSRRVTDVESSLDAQLSALDVRVSDVEKAPSADGTLSDTALAAYQRELDQLREELDAQQESVMSAAAQAEADLAAAREEAAQLEQDAIATAEAAAARAALNRVAAAVETGAPFADALSALDGEDIPAALEASAVTGVATTAQLTQEFPAAARTALATARSEGVSDDAGGFSGFLRNQFDVRSTAPQEGPGPDAVLSRAEAAIKEGRVADALAEIEALPEVARAEMIDWTARATQRADVLDAIATLSETYN